MIANGERATKGSSTMATRAMRQVKSDGNFGFGGSGGLFTDLSDMDRMTGT